MRADEARRRLDFSRSLVLGSILGKRILDLFVVICLLLVGGAWLPLSGAGAVPAIFGNFALNAALLGGALGAGVMLLPRLCRVGNFTFGTRMSSDQTRGLGSVGESRGAEALAFTFAIWSREALSLWLLVAAFGISLAPAQLGLLVAVSSLSTLVPGAPGYVGTYQLAMYSCSRRSGCPPRSGCWRRRPRRYSCSVRLPALPWFCV